MEFLHKKIYQKSRYYKKWHSYKHHSKFHWGLFLFVALFSLFNLFTVYSFTIEDISKNTTVQIMRITAYAQTAPLWEKPADSSTISNTVDLIVDADLNSDWVRWCYTQSNSCDPSVIGVNMNYSVASQLWESTWDTTTVLDGSYKLCSSSSLNNSLSSISCISVTVQNSSNGGSGNAVNKTLKSDLNCDGKIDVVDFGILLSWWGPYPDPNKTLSSDGKYSNPNCLP